MAATANGINTLLVLGKQTAEGTKALVGAGQLYPRVTSSFDTDALYQWCSSALRRTSAGQQYAR